MTSTTTMIARTAAAMASFIVARTKSAASIPKAAVTFASGDAIGATRQSQKRSDEPPSCLNKSAIHKSTRPEKNALVSMPAPETLEREKDKLWVKDSELIRRMGVPDQIAREAIRMLDEKPSGFPKKQKLWGDRRYWPAVKAYFDALYGVKVDDPQRRQRS